MSAEQQSAVFRFGDFEVCERDMRLTRAGETVALEPKAFRVLLYFLRNPGRLITKDELLNAVWGDTSVEENSLTRAISLLRRVLGDDARAPHYIETAAAFGYRFVCKIETTAGPAEAKPPQSVRPKSNGRKWLLPTLAAGVAAVAAAIWYLGRPLPPPRVTAMAQITFDGGEKNLVGTDGPRIYFGRENTMHRSVFAVPAAGGATIEIPIAIPNNVGLEGVSPDGADVLVSTDAYGVSFQRRPLWIVRALDGVPGHPLPDGAYPAFSPDGKSVVYSAPDGSICLVGSNGEGARKIASVNGASSFAWSPDGRIRFTKDRHLWEIKSDGSNLHQLLSGWNDSPWQCCGRWTADGNLFVFLSPEKASGGSEIWALGERRGLLRRKPRTPIRLATGPIRWTSVLPAKDPKTLFATGEVLRGELVRFDSRTQQFLPFLGGISALGPQWSPDGRFVVYVTFPDGFLFRANADGSNPVQLTDSRFHVFRPTWSPDGAQILFQDAQAIYVIPAAGGAAQRVIRDDREPESDPTWSPDGKKIAFAVQPAEMPNYHIRVVDLMAHAVSDLPGSMGMFSPRWSPDGRFIAALTHDNLNIKIFDTTTETWTTLVEKMFAGYPNWSRDGRWLYFGTNDSSDKYSIRRVRVSGGKPDLVAPLPAVNQAGWWGWFGLDATNTPLIMRDIGRHEIYALTLER